MTLHFGLQFDHPVYPEASQGGPHYGPKGLLHLLESYCGLAQNTGDNPHLRIEQYRQALVAYAEKESDLFYQATLQTDQFAAATTLLQMRDELLLAGWDFQIDEQCPSRLQVLARIEADLRAIDNDRTLSPGYADRFVALLEVIDEHPIPFNDILCNEPLDLLPAHLRKLFEKLKAKGIPISQVNYPDVVGDSDLALFKKALLRRTNDGGKATLKNDGSLIVLRTRRDTEAAEYIAQLLRLQPSYKPLCLIPEKSRVLDNALVQEGLPSLGISSASLARPSLQILKLATAFLWNPLDPFKILEFVTLPYQPLDKHLAARIAMLMAQSPGLNSRNWYAVVEGFFEELQQQFDSGNKKIDPQAIREEYDFWFNRKRYDINKSVPKEQVIPIFSRISYWARQLFADAPLKNNNVLVLSRQAQSIVDFLEALPKNEAFLSQLRLERIVRTIYEPSPVLFKEKECGHLPFIHHTSTITAPCENLLWWNFARNEYEHFFSRWYKHELDYLSEKGILLSLPEDKNKLLLWQRPRPVLFTQKQLLLIVPEMVNGSEVFPHPLFEEMEAALQGIEKISYSIDDEESMARLATHFQLPDKIYLAFRQPAELQAFLQVESPEDLSPREEETLTSLENLFYYPYQWVFRYKLRLRKSSILSVIGDNTLKGNLAHRFFENLLQQDFYDWDKKDIYQWIDRQAPKLLRREGAVLLMYGREPERYDFISKIKYAALSLLSAIKSNNWKVLATEMDIAGDFEDIRLKGKADLVLQRGNDFFIVDLKWRGATRRENMIKSGDDLQLITYCHLLDAPLENVHTAYFIIENGKFIARNNLAIEEATAVMPYDDHRDIHRQIFDRMKKTYLWRRQQLDNGLVEVRTTDTVQDLEEAYEGELMHLLELPDKEAAFDDYRVLIGLVD